MRLGWLAVLAAGLALGACQPGPGFNGGGFGGWPGGSWAETCRDAQLRGGLLIARCRERDGDWRMTSIRYTDCPGRRVRNDNGRLECEGGWAGGGWGGSGGWQPDDGGWGGGWAGGGPRGSWVQSCRQAQVSGNRLTALCRERDGGWNRSSIVYTQCPGYRVANRDGWLRCEG